jgi:hypothetical protein
MGYEFFWKAGTLLIGVIGAGKILYDLTLGKRGRMRDEFNFAKAFLDVVKSDPNLHPYLREKGYAAIAGDANLNADQIEYLLTLMKPDRALRYFVLGRPYLDHLPDSGDLQIEFKPKYRTAWSRKWRLGLYFGLYFVLAFAAFSPLVFSGFLGIKASGILVLTAMSIGTCLPGALLAMKSAIRIHRAQELVKNQHKHTQRVVVSDPTIFSRKRIG